MVDTHIKHLGFALRYHNEHNPEDKIILQDVMKDVIEFETERPKGRSVAQNHFLCLLTLGSTIERHKNCARGDRNLAKVDAWTRIQTMILDAFDIPEGILIGLGYNVAIADEGARYSEKERRHACHSQLKDFITTMTETQAGTDGPLHNIDRWDEPLLVSDGRLPDELDAWNDEEPSWARDDSTAGSHARGGTAHQGGPQAQPTATPGGNVQPKRMPRPSTSGGATSSSQSAFRTGPGPTSSGEHRATEEEDQDKTPKVDWVKKKKKPSNVDTHIHAAMDYDHQEQRITFLRSSRNFVVSTAGGPHSTHVYGSNLAWRQYLRRVTFHAALAYNILTEGQMDAQMLNENDHEWLKLYHYLTTTTELVRCKGYPITEVLAMLTLGIQETVDGDIRKRLRGLSNQIGQFITDKPWIESWDELGGQVRMNKCLILTDLTYQTKSSSRTTHDIEAGLNNLGVASIKVYQLPYEALEDTEAFLQLARDALKFLRNNADTLTNITVHVWISFASLIKGQNRILVPEDGLCQKFGRDHC